MLSSEPAASRIGLRAKFIVALALQTIIIAVLIVIIEQWSVKRALRQQTIGQGEAIARTIGSSSPAQAAIQSHIVDRESSTPWRRRMPSWR